MRTGAFEAAERLESALSNEVEDVRRTAASPTSITGLELLTRTTDGPLQALPSSGQERAALLVEGSGVCCALRAFDVHLEFLRPTFCWHGHALSLDFLHCGDVRSEPSYTGGFAHLRARPGSLVERPCESRMEAQSTNLGRKLGVLRFTGSTPKLDNPARGCTLADSLDYWTPSPTLILVLNLSHPQSP